MSLRLAMKASLQEVAVQPSSTQQDDDPEIKPLPPPRGRGSRNMPTPEPIQAAMDEGIEGEGVPQKGGNRRGGDRKAATPSPVEELAAATGAKAKRPRSRVAAAKEAELPIEEIAGDDGRNRIGPPQNVEEPEREMEQVVSTAGEETAVAADVVAAAPPQQETPSKKADDDWDDIVSGITERDRLKMEKMKQQQQQQLPAAEDGLSGASALDGTSGGGGGSRMPRIPKKSANVAVPASQEFTFMSEAASSRASGGAGGGSRAQGDYRGSLSRGGGARAGDRGGGGPRSDSRGGRESRWQKGVGEEERERVSTTGTSRRSYEESRPSASAAAVSGAATPTKQQQQTTSSAATTSTTAATSLLASTAVGGSTAAASAGGGAAAAPPTVPDFVIPRTEPRRKEQVQELQDKLQSAIRGCKILQVSKLRDALGEYDPINKEGSFIKQYMSDWAVYDEYGKPLVEPKAPEDVPLLEEDFAVRGKQDHDSRWWGVRLTSHDDDQRR